MWKVHHLIFNKEVIHVDKVLVIFGSHRSYLSMASRGSLFRSFYLLTNMIFIPSIEFFYAKSPFLNELELYKYHLDHLKYCFSIEIMRFLNWIFDIMQSRANIVSSNRSYDLVIRIKFRLLCKNVREFIYRWKSAVRCRPDQTFGSNQSSFYRDVRIIFICGTIN